MLRESDRVRATNERFYKALSTQNMLDMETLWSHGEHVRCVHLGGPLLEGWDAIRESWRAIFTQALCMTVQPQGAQITVLGPAAVVTCRERITSITLEGSVVVAAQATNVFEKKDGSWHMIHHHASNVSVQDGGTSGGIK